ncbi:MAG: IclR family transcriptional regulator [Sporomusa sp.]|nr:IclR family transcriptional regulator [Sporomusa sp.]
MATLKKHRPTARVLDILELLASTNDGYTLTEIANAIDAPKSTILPIIRTLCDRNFLALNNISSRYIIGINAFMVGSACLKNMDILSLLKSELQQIVDVTSETCQLGILVNGSDVLYLIKVESPEPLRLVSFVGKQLPAYCSAIGKALISQYSFEQLHKVYPNGLKPMTANTITDFTALYNELEVICKTGIAFEAGESNIDSQCLAVPLKKGNHIVAAISVSMPTYRVTSEKLELIKVQLLKAQQKVESIFHDLNIDAHTLFSPGYSK